MKSKMLTVVFLILCQDAAAQVDLSSYDTVYVDIATPNDNDYDVERRYLAGLLIGYMRGTEDFTHVHMAEEGDSHGVLLDVNITHMRVVGGVTRAISGALTGKDKLAGDVRFMDLATGAVLAETTVDGSGSRGFLFNRASATIYVALSEFADSVNEWAGYGVARFGAPIDWHGVLDRDSAIAVQCSGIDKKSAEVLVRLKQNNATVCATLTEALERAHVSVIDDSPIVLSLSLDAFGRGANKRYRPVLIMRWHVEGPDGIIHNDVIASTGPEAKGRKAARSSAAETVRSQVQMGVDALWPP